MTFTHSGQPNIAPFGPTYPVSCGLPVGTDFNTYTSDMRAGHHGNVAGWAGGPFGNNAEILQNNYHTVRPSAQHPTSDNEGGYFGNRGGNGGGDGYSGGNNRLPGYPYGTGLGRPSDNNGPVGPTGFGGPLRIWWIWWIRGANTPRIWW